MVPDYGSKVLEHRRQGVLAHYRILDTGRERGFDDLAMLASEICGTPIAIVNLISSDRQWFKAERGLGVNSTPLETSFCATAILEEDFLQIPDATQDARFSCNPLVQGEPALRFYAGALLKSPDGVAFGTLCVLDYQPRLLSEQQQRALRTLARQVIAQLDLRLALIEQEETNAELRATEEQLRDLNQRLEARVAEAVTEQIEERERIARELHDTLLQSVQSLTLRFQLALNKLPVREPARPALEAAIDHADQVIAEGRDRVMGLRSRKEKCDLATALADLVARQAFEPSVAVKITAVGIPRPIAPRLLDEARIIAGEAIFNIWRHASATEVAIEIGYHADFGLRFSDNGIGIDPEIASAGAEGHFGLFGMRERARRLRGELAVRLRSEGGTEVVLTVPGALAYDGDQRD